jgi:LmbE family N-acetylglucosaminyl deacetylase
MNDSLPAMPSVLVVCAHPDDESFGLGAILSALADTGSRVSALLHPRRSLHPPRRRR